MNKPSDDATERLPRPVAQALERQNRRLERVESKVDRILELLQKIDTRLDDDDLDEFEDFEDDLDEPADMDAITKELENLSPEELKKQLVQLIATMSAAAADEEEEP